MRDSTNKLYENKQAKLQFQASSELSLFRTSAC